MTSILRVSVITPSYNQAPFLEATIRSVLEQDYPHIEYIICDGGSTDGSVDIIRQYAHRLAYWCSEKDGGQSEAINKGMARASGEIVGWLNSDDVYMKNGISTIIRGFEAYSHAGLIYGDLQLIDEQSRIIGQHPTRSYNFADQLTHRTIIPQPAAFWRRQVLDMVGPVRQDLHYAMDFEFWIRIGLRFPIIYVPGLIAQFRISGVNKGSAQSAKWGAELFRILDEFYAQPDLPRNVVKLKSAAYAGAYWMGATTSLTALDMKQTRKWLWEAAWRNPNYLVAGDWWTTLVKASMGRPLNRWGRALKVSWRDRYNRNS